MRMILIIAMMLFANSALACIGKQCMKPGDVVHIECVESGKCPPPKKPKTK